MTIVYETREQAEAAAKCQPECLQKHIGVMQVNGGWSYGLKRNTLKAIEQAPYGTPEQLQAIDAWYARFVKFADAHPMLADLVWQRVHQSDVAYMARRRWLYEQYQKEECR